MQIIIALLFVLDINARELPPGQMLLPEEFPEYEAKIDHARLIQDTSKEGSNWQIGLPTKLCKLPRQSIGSRISPQCPQVLGRAISMGKTPYHVSDPYPWLANDGSAGDAQAPGKNAVIHYIRGLLKKKKKPFPLQ